MITNHFAAATVLVAIPHGRLAGSVADVWAEKQAALMPVPPAFDGLGASASRPPA